MFLRVDFIDVGEDTVQSDVVWNLESQMFVLGGVLDVRSVIVEQEDLFRSNLYSGFFLESPDDTFDVLLLTTPDSFQLYFEVHGILVNFDRYFFIRIAAITSTDDAGNHTDIFCSISYIRMFRNGYKQGT